MSDDQMRPIEQVLPGLRIDPLPESWSPLEGIVLVKCLDDEGVPTWAFRTTSGVNDEELLGALTVRIEILRRELVDGYLAEPADEE